MPRFGNRRRVRRERLYSSYGYSSYRYGSILSIFERYGHRRYTSSSFISYGPPRRRPFGYERDCRWRERYYERENRKKELEEKEEEERLEKNRKRREEKEKKRKERQRQKEKEEREKAKEEDRKELERLEKEREEKEKKDKRERERLAEERRKQKERREREKREEAERIRKAKEERLRKEKEEKERAAREAKEREAKRVLEVKEVNLRIGENAKRHHTDKFRLTQDKDAELVVRRGQLFVMDITFDRPYNIEYHDLSLIFCIGDKPSKLRGTKFEILLDEEGNQSASPEEWYARLIHRHENSITVEVRTACDCIIGEWSLHISTSGKDKEGRETRDLYEHPEDINILFNPWCKDDRVYMADESLLEEYILNDQGAIFAGSHDSMSAKLWNFGQFDDGILEICFTLLRKGNGWEFSKKLGDPIAISRMLSHLINYSGYGDEGVLIGNWSGDYSDGTSPTFWTGSADILKQYDENNGEMVKYGQCWVFSGVTTTVCRALGLPCKSVTCFNSAHDTDQSTTRDIVYKIKDGKLEKDSALSRDSVWNFHVWNEVFMKRPDLNDDKFNGWQVIDATPQEESEGMFVCGPASVRAIKDGLVSWPHEAKFIFAEVNCDVITWIVDGKQWAKVLVDTTSVGTRIMSKNPDGEPYTDNLTIYNNMLWNSPHDVTRHYKYPEGSIEERIAVRKAGNASTTHRARGDYTPPLKHLEVYMDECDSVSTGEDFILIFHLKNISNEAVEVCKTNAKLYTKKYTGDINALVLDSDFQDMKIEPQKEVKVEIECKANVYLPKIVEQGNMEMILTAKVANIEEYIMKSEKFRLRRPDIDVECASKGKLGEKCKVKMSFKNHMPVPLTKCKLIVDGAGFFTENRKEPDVKPGGIWEETIELTPKRKGKNQIIASFDCVELPDIIGKADVFIY